MADRYLVASGNVTWNSSNTALWSATSGGATGASVPTSADDVFIDANSGTGTIKFATVVCKSLNFTGFTGTFAHDSAGSNLTIHGGLTMVAGMTSGVTSGTFTFASTTDNGGAGWPITTNGKTLPNVTFNGVGGKWTLQDALTLITNASLTVTAGHFDSGNYNMSIGRFISSNNNVRTISLGSSVVTLTRDADLSSVGNLTWSTNTAVLRFGTQNGISAGTPFDYRGLSLEYTAVGSVGCTLYGSGTFKDLTVVGGATALAFTMNGNPVFTGTVSISGNSSTNRLLVQSNSLGTPRVITAAATSLTDVDFMDIAIVGPTGSTITSDSFNRADGALVGSTSDAAAGGTGVVWAGSDGTWSIASNKASRSGSGSLSFAVVETGTSDQWVQTTYQSGTIGLVARYTDAANCIYVNYSGSASGLTVLRGGSIVYVAGLPAPHNTAVAGDVITLAVNGNVVRVMKNGNIVYWSVPQYTTVLTQAESTLSGTKAGLSTNATAGSSDDFKVQTIPNVTGTRLGDCLGNSGIEFTTASGTPRDGGGAGVKRYAVAPGNFSDTSMWSESSGGAPGASVPLPQDDVYLDANSAAGRYSMNQPQSCRDLICTGFTGSVGSEVMSTSIYGDLTVGAATTLSTQGGGNLTIAKRSGGMITTNGATLDLSVYFSGGVYSLADSLTLGASRALSIGNFSALTTNSHTLSIGRFTTGTGAATKTIDFGTSVVNIYSTNAGTEATFYMHPGPTTATGTPTINIVNPTSNTRTISAVAPSFSVGTLTYTVADSPGALTITGSNTFGTVNIGSGRSLRLTSGTTQKIGTLNLNGTLTGKVITTGNGQITSPDSSAIGLTGTDIDIRVRLASSWGASYAARFIDHYVTAYTGMGWAFGQNGNNKEFTLHLSSDGTSWAVGVVSAIHSLANAPTVHWIRVTWRRSDGRVQFFTAPDSTSMPTSWTQLGADQTNKSPGLNIFDSTGPLTIGGKIQGDTYYWVQVRNNVLDDGTGIVFNANFANRNMTEVSTMTESSSNAAVVTIASPANLTDGRVVIESVTAGSAATLQVDTVTGMNYVDLRDVVMNGADTYIGATSVIRSNVKGVRRGPKTGLGV